MHKIKTAIAGILALFVASAAVAQTFPTVASQSVIGRLGVPGTSGPSQAIPIATLAAQPAFKAQASMSVPLTSFGAVCDGSTDDTAAFHAAFTAAQTRNLTISLPPSTCIWGDEVNLSTGNVTIQGQGASSVLKAKNGANLDYMLLTGGTNTLKMYDLVFDGNRAGGGAKSSLSYGLVMQTDNFIARGVEFRNHMRIAVAFFLTPSNVVFDACWFHDIGTSVVAGTGNIGVGLFGEVDNIRVVNSTFEEIHTTVTPIGDSSAINLKASSGIVANNKFKNNYNVNGGQLALSGGGDKASLIIVQGNLLEQTGTYDSDQTAGIEINADNAVVLGNICKGVSADCIRVEGTSTNVVVSNNSSDGAADTGINLINTPTKVALRGNYITNSPVGVSIQNSADILMEDNWIDSATVATPIVGAANLSTYRLNKGANPAEMEVFNGGTGIASYTVGDLLYASAAGALSRLAAVATGNALISGGVGVAPSWGKIGISTHVSGLGTSVATALGVNVGTGGSVVTNGGALGSPSSVGTLPAHTLGGTISGGGNQINNVIIGASTPLAGSFTTLALTGNVTQTVNSPTFTQNKSGSGQQNVITGQSAGLNRWVFLFGDTNPESGSNAGSDYQLLRYDDAGGFIGSAMTITRATGQTTFPSTIASTSAATGSVTAGGGIGAAGAVWAGTYVSTTPTTVATSGTTCSIKGARWFVTDNNTALSFGAVITSGGSIQTPIYCDGTVWRQGANDNIPASLLRKYA